MIKFGILGPVEALQDGAEMRLGGRNQRGVLALLLLQPGRVVSIERIAEELYDGEAPVSAVTQIHRQVSELRRALDPGGDPERSVIETRAPGYLARVAADDVDLGRFETLSERGAAALRGGDPAVASDALREALALWRGPALADLASEPFAQRPIARLDELRLAALEHRVEADLRLGRDSDLVPELRELAEAFPLRERLREMLMLALYRAGRQVEALDVYREARRELSDSFGLEPGPGLRELERAILRHDPALAPSPVSAPWQSEPEGTLLVAARDPHELRAMSRIAAELARRPPRELLVTLLVPDESALGAATAELARQRETLGEGVRTAAFVAPDLAEDVRRLVRAHDLDLVLVGVPPGFGDDPGPPPPELAAVLEQSACDVAIVSGTPTPSGGDGGVVVPFGGGEHDWAAAELGAWLAAATGMRLRLAGARAGPGSGGRDASRLLADASLAVQRTVGIAAEPFLVDPGTDGLLEAAAEGSAVVIGLSSRWRREGLGDARRAVVAGARCPVLVVHRGPRPSGIAPRASATRFTWSLGSDRS